MRLILALSVLITLPACDKYTEQTSPCFGKTGKPLKAKSTTPHLSFAQKNPLSDDCVFEHLDQVG